MTTDTPRTRWVRAQLKVVDVDAGKVPGQYNDAVLSEQTIVLPLTGAHGALIALDELGQALRTMVAQATRVHPLSLPEVQDAASGVEPAGHQQPAAVAADVDDIPF